MANKELLRLIDKMTLKECQDHQQRIELDIIKVNRSLSHRNSKTDAQWRKKAKYYRSKLVEVKERLQKRVKVLNSTTGVNEELELYKTLLKKHFPKVYEAINKEVDQRLNNQHQ